MKLELGLRPLEERHQDSAHLLAGPRRGLSPALVDELAQPRRAGRRLELAQLEVCVVDSELGENRLVVAQRLARRAVLVAEPADEVRDLETDRRRPIGLVLHGLSHDPGGLAERQARVRAIRAPRPVTRDERVGRASLRRDQRFVEKRELAIGVDRDRRFVALDGHPRRVRHGPRQSLAKLATHRHGA